jgi:hypothetical protein
MHLGCSFKKYIIKGRIVLVFPTAQMQMLSAFQCGGLSGYNIESLIVDHSGQRVTHCTLKTSFVDFKIE